MTISLRAVDVLATQAGGVIGQRASNRSGDRSETLLNSSPQAKEVRTITVDTATGDATYTWTLAGQVQSVVAASSTSATLIALQIVAAINTDPVTRGLVVASSAAGVVTVTALRYAVAFTLSDADAKLTCALVTAAASATAVPFGRFVILTGYNGSNKLGTLASSAALAKQVDTWTTTYVASTNYKWHVKVDDRDYSGSVVADTNTATTLTAIAADITAIVPAAKVVAAATSTTVTLTAAFAGLGFESDLHADSSGLSVPAATVSSTSGIGTDARLAAAGVSLYRGDIPLDASGVAQYAANEGIEAIQRGEVWVSVSSAVSAGDRVHVELAASAPGTFLAADSGTSIRLDAARYGRTDTVSGLTILEVL